MSDVSKTQAVQDSVNSVIKGRRSLRQLLREDIF